MNINININQLEISFRKARILVVGDLMLDRYLFGKSERQSPEAPVPIINQTKKLNLLGGASNVCINISSLVSNAVTCCGLIGNDKAGKNIIELLHNNNISSEGVISDLKHLTTVKERIYSNKKQVVRIDKENEVISKISSELILNFIKKTISNYDVIILSDYNKGVINDELVTELVDLNKGSIPIIVDPKKKNINEYRGVDLITPNLKELQDANNAIYSSNKEVIKANCDIMIKNDIKNIVTTLGQKGMIVSEMNRNTYIKGFNVKTPDVVGAGDTVIATIALCLSSGMNILQSSMIANIAASISVSKIGTSKISFDELKSKIKI